MKNTNFFSVKKLNTKLGFLIVQATLLLFANIGFAQTPELFEDKVLINNIAAPWGFTFINNN
ncbi:MAG: hypothetical protein WCI53_13290 [Bacteroidota bacterium]